MYGLMCMAWFCFSMEYQEEAEISPVPRVPDLKLRVEDHYQLEALPCLEYVLTQALERLDKKNIYPVQGALTESMNTSESNLEIESDQPSLAPDMSPIRRPKYHHSYPTVS